MSLFDDTRYSWRETYFVFFDPRRRPLLDAVHHELDNHAGTFRILDQQVNAEGLFRRLTLASYEDHAALEIVYHQGKAVADEIHALVETLFSACTPKEKEQLDKVLSFRAKFDILHFEQMAGTAEFNIVKMPDLTFAPKHRTQLESGKGGDSLRGRFTKNRSSDTLPASERFHFDPESYANCYGGDASTRGEEQMSMGEEDSDVIERIDPNTLVLVLETLCRISGGIAVDPASGVVL